MFGCVVLAFLRFSSYVVLYLFAGSPLIYEFSQTALFPAFFVWFLHSKCAIFVAVFARAVLACVFGCVVLAFLRFPSYVVLYLFAGSPLLYEFSQTALFPAFLCGFCTQNVQFSLRFLRVLYFVCLPTFVGT